MSYVNPLKDVDVWDVAVYVAEAVRETFLIQFPGNPSFYHSADDCSCVVCYSTDGYLDRHVAVTELRVGCDGNADLHELIDLVNILLGCTDGELRATVILKRMDELAEQLVDYIPEQLPDTGNEPG